MNPMNEAVRAFLEAQSTLALATVNADGQPEVTPVFYVSDEALALYWLSATSSRHSLNLTSQPRVAATIYPAVWGWNDIRGVQVEGEAQAVTDVLIREPILSRYLQK